MDEGAWWALAILGGAMPLWLLVITAMEIASALKEGREVADD